MESKFVWVFFRYDSEYRLVKKIGVDKDRHYV